MSKLGLHIISWNQSQAILDFMAQAQPHVCKMLEFNEMNTDVARADSPGAIFIGRQYVNNQPLDNPAQNAQDFFNQLLPAIWKMGDRITVWEGYNEIILNSIDDAKRYNDFTVAWAEIMHSQGLRCAAYSFSTGNPDLSYWPYLVDGARACDYLALHEYDYPRMDSHVGGMCLRYRKVRALLPPDAWRPILITECGIDDGQNHGWKSYASGDSYISQLAWYDSELMCDDYVYGATIFTVDGKDWAGFDVLPILNPLANYIASTPSPLPPPLPAPGVPTITAAALTPTNLTAGQLLNVSVTVTNMTTQTLPTQDPAPGFVYNERENFRSRGFREVPGAFRIGIDFDSRTGIDHPYRWGLGAPLAPGKSVTVTGAVRLNTAQVRNYWAGLVQETVVWQQDNVGRQQITVKPGVPTGTQPVITAVTLQPTSLNSGDQLNISITVQNNSNLILPTQGPNPGFVYNEGDDFRSRGFTETANSVRVGIEYEGHGGVDHPYRWGLGNPLSPGQSVTITGGIRLITAQARNYWAGLVREQVAWLQDHQGLQFITVSGAPGGGGATQPTITAVTLSPTVMPQGELLQVSVTLKNTTNTALPTQGPDPGFVYNEGDNFLTKQYPPVQSAFRIGVDYDGRTGVDHPYRWGLGGTLAPGQSVTVTGYIRLNRRQVTNFRVALIQEGAQTIKDNLGTTAITVVKA